MLGFLTNNTYLYEQIHRKITTLVDELETKQSKCILITNETYAVICIVVLTINLDKAKLRIYAAMRKVAKHIDGIVTP